MLEPWITVDDLADPPDHFTADWAIRASTWILFKLSGEKYSGTRTDTDYYSVNGSSSSAYAPEVISGHIVNLPRYSSGITNLRLRQTPVLSVESIYIGSELQDPTTYQLRNNAYVVRRNKQPWVLDPLNEIEITYTHGTPPPSMGKVAAIRFANELIWNEIDSDKCTLPERVSSSMTRQGVSYTILDPMEFIKDGHIGIPMVDMFLNAANPNKAKKKPKIFSPDKPRGERVN